MHPFLGEWKPTVALGIAWALFSAAVIYVVHLIADLALLQAFILTAPVAAGQLLIFLSVWYLCKVTPLNTAGLGAFLARHGITVMVMSAIGLQLSMMYSELLVQLTGLELYRTAFERLVPVLLILSFLVYISGTSISYLILALEEGRQVENLALQSQLKAGRQELQFLKSRIHPHFLFNSLNGLSALCITAPDKARALCLNLADFLRYSFAYSNNNYVTLAEELEHAENYIAIESTRLGNRLKFSSSINTRPDKEYVISFCLQPLLENAVKHGVETISGGSTVELTIDSNEHYLVVDVSNPWRANSSKRSGSGFGLNNLRDRLKYSYGEKARLTIHKGEQYFSVRLFLPRMTKPQTQEHAPVSG